MNKVKDFVVKNAQWIAISVGGLWLLYMIYAHVLASPTATVEVKGAPQPLGPGAVDEYVKTAAIDPLKSGIANTNTIKDPKVDYVAQIKGAYELVGETPVAMIGNLMIRPTDIKGPQVAVVGPGGPVLQPREALGIPTAPAPTQVVAITGKSIVNGPGQNNAVGAQQRQLWVTVFGTLPMAELAKAFDAVKIPNVNVLPAQQTTLLKVEIIREELLSNGQWGNSKTIMSQPIDLANPASAPPPQFPDNQMLAQLQYRVWAAVNQKLIAQPGFFVVAKGDGWHMPGEEAKQIGLPEHVEPAPVVPVAPVPRPPVRPTPVRPPGMPPGQPRGPKGGPTGMISPAQSPATVTNVLQVFGGEPMPMPNPTGMPPGAPPPGSIPGSTGPGAAGAAAPPPQANAVGQAPAALFEPRFAADIQLWAHDLQVESGKTYRYKMRYTISNPLFTFKNLLPADKQALAAQFSIDSAISKESAPVQIPDTTSYFVNNANAGRASATIDVFVWGIGGVVKTRVTAEPGDLVDENLKLTLADVREGAGGDQIVILVDDNGNLIRRSRREDNRDTRYITLQKEAVSAPAGGPVGALGGQ